jgi:hypothetical protein
MMQPEELEQLLAVAYETRSFEVKGPGLLKDKAFCAKVARAVMAMGNLSGMGYVCVGIAEPQMKQMLPGLDDEQLRQWANFDDVSAAMARFSDPPVAFDLNPLTLSSGASVVLLEVEEFDDVPYLCKRGYPEELQEGAAYVRPRGKPESVPVPNASEMRELLDTATGKRVRELLRRLGLQLPAPTSPEAQDRARFDDEYKAVWAEPSPVVDDITTHAYFDVAVHPATFDPNRVPVATLQQIVIDNTVRLRGWPVPFAGRVTPKRFPTWVGEDPELASSRHAEAWRMCTSGQFLQRRVLTTDLVTDNAELRPDSDDATGAVAVWDILLYAVEVAEFGANVAQSLNLDSVTLRMSMNGVAGRELISGDWKRELHGPYTFAGNTISSERAFNSTELLTKAREAGVDVSQDLLRPFGLDIPDQVLIDWQDQVFSRR